MYTWFKRTAFALVGLFCALWCVTTVVGVHLTIRPRTSHFEDIDTLAGQAVESVIFQTEDGIAISAWYVPARTEHAVALLAGIDANRNSCRSRGEFYLEQGYAVLLPDLRASGKSEGAAVTIGWHERKDLVAAVRFLQERGYTHIGANGVSLGAATICYAVPSLPELSFIVLESSYDSLRTAVKNRLRMYYTPHFIGYPFYAGFALMTGSPPWRMRPAAFLRQCQTPTLIMAGDSEPEIPVRDTYALYNQCAAPLKRLHFFEGGRHQDFLSKYPDDYRALVTSFLEEVVAFTENSQESQSQRP